MLETRSLDECGRCGASVVGRAARGLRIGSRVAAGQSGDSVQRRLRQRPSRGWCFGGYGTKRRHGNPLTVTGTTTTLVVQGTENGGGAGLIYTWTTTDGPSADVTFSRNDTATAKSTVAKFPEAGTYELPGHDRGHGRAVRDFHCQRDGQTDPENHRYHARQRAS